MSKLLQRGAASAIRARLMSSLPDTSKMTPEQLHELGRKINPAQTVFGPKSKNIEKWQKFFQDPINASKPMYKRKGFTDELIYQIIVVAVAAEFALNMYSAATN